MLQPIEDAIGFFRPAVGRFHQTRPAAGHDREIRLRYSCSQFARECIVGMRRRETRRPEDRNTRPHEVEGTKAMDQFAKDP